MTARRFTSKDLKEAQALYRLTHGGISPPGVFSTMVAPDTELVSVELGALVAVEYSTDKGGGEESFRHAFRASCRPVLSFNETGLLILGGQYRVTRRGIEG